MIDSLLLKTAYLPPIDYVTSIVNAKEIVIEANENYTKQTYSNRCYIYTAGGKQLLSVPVRKPDGNHTLIKNVLISYDTNWQRTHWRAIETAYNSSPYFLYYKDDLIHFYQNRINSLMELNNELLKVILKLIGVEKEIRFSQSFKLKESERYKTNYTAHEYQQVFTARYGFIANLSIIDLLFNMGPDSLRIMNYKL